MSRQTNVFVCLFVSFSFSSAAPYCPGLQWAETLGSWGVPGPRRLPCASRSNLIINYPSHRLPPLSLPSVSKAKFLSLHRIHHRHRHHHRLLLPSPGDFTTACLRPLRATPMGLVVLGCLVALGPLLGRSHLLPLPLGELPITCLRKGKLMDKCSRVVFLKNLF